MKKGTTAKRNYSSISLEEAMTLIGRDTFLRWQLPVNSRPPSDRLNEDLRRLESFDLQTTEQAKTLLIDALFLEVVPNHPKLKVWKAAVLKTDTLTGGADYLIAPKRAFLTTPLLCVTEAKRDDFERGRAQCIAEMAACVWNNRQRGHEADVFGVVSNGQGWQFYSLTQAGDIFESEVYGISALPILLGVLHSICTECANNIP